MAILIIVATRGYAQKNSSRDEFVQEWGFSSFGDNPDITYDYLHRLEGKADLLIFHGYAGRFLSKRSNSHSLSELESSPNIRDSKKRKISSFEFKGYSEIYLFYHGYTTDDVNQFGLPNLTIKAPYSSEGDGAAAHKFLTKLKSISDLKKYEKEILNIIDSPMMLDFTLLEVQTKLLCIWLNIGIILHCNSKQGDSSDRIKSDAIEDAFAHANEIERLAEGNTFRNAIGRARDSRIQGSSCSGLMWVFRPSSVFNHKALEPATFWDKFTQRIAYQSIREDQLQQLRQSFCMVGRAINFLRSGKVLQ
ncbi:MAG: hypothetical protein QMD09_11465 [Desulfatibacillaceae bacterium]|nr:hypothetical protein [Desulfatibacillaceae bacterium]